MPKCNECHWWRLIGESAPNNGVELGQCLGRAPNGCAVAIPSVHPISREVGAQIIEITVWGKTLADCESCGDFKAGLTVPKLQEIKTVGVQVDENGVIEVP